MNMLLNGKIEAALKQLNVMFNENSSKARKVFQLLKTDLPEQVQLLAHYIEKNDWLKAASVLHKLKSHFGYLDLGDTVTKISEWESELRTEPTILLKNQQERLAEFRSMSNEIVNILNEMNSSHYTTPEQSVAQQNQVLAGKLVLVAEDDDVNGMVFELFVKELGANVIKAYDGKEAIRLALESSPDMIFMDIHMPFYSGLDAIRELRAKSVTCPMISLSASTRLNEKQRSLDAGANDFLVKPANRAAINGVLMKYLLA